MSARAARRSRTPCASSGSRRRSSTCWPTAGCRPATPGRCSVRPIARSRSAWLGRRPVRAGPCGRSRRRCATGEWCPRRRRRRPPAPAPTPVDGAGLTEATRLRPPGLLELEQLLADALDTRVGVQMTAKRGKVTIDFADLEDLERIYRLIIGEAERGLDPPSTRPLHLTSTVAHSEWTTLWISAITPGHRRWPHAAPAGVGSVSSTGAAAQSGPGPRPRRSLVARRGCRRPASGPPSRAAPMASPTSGVEAVTAATGPSAHRTAGMRVSRSTGSRIPAARWPERQMPASRCGRRADGRRPTRSRRWRSRPRRRAPRCAAEADVHVAA